MLSAFIPSRLSYPAVLLAEQLVHQRSVHPGPLVLRTAPLKFPTPATDRDRTVSRRSEPSSRAALMGEQPNPWDLLQPQDATSRHRGAKPPVDVDSWGRSACYPRGSFYPLSDGPPTRYHRITKPDFRPSRLVGLAVRLPYAFALYERFPTVLREPLGAPLLFRRRPPQSNCPPNNVQSPDSWRPVRTPVLSGWYPKVDSTKLTP